MDRLLVTGATGLLGRHVVNQLLVAGHRVTATSRSIQDSDFVDSSKLSIVQADLTSSKLVDRLVEDAQVVIHCAARTTNWGTFGEFELGNITTTQNLVDACGKHNVQRLLQVSSIAVYGHPPTNHRKIVESDPVGQNLLAFDRYNRSKITAEQTVVQLGSRATIVRPTWFIGPGDRTFVPSLVRKLKKGALWVLGSGANYLNGLSVDDIANGVILAATSANGGGQIFNLCSDGELTQRQFLDIICEHQGLPKLRRRIPMPVARLYASLIEYTFRLSMSQSKPPITRHDLTVFSRPTQFSNQKAKDTLGWRTVKSLEQSLRETLDSMDDEHIGE